MTRGDKVFVPEFVGARAVVARGVFLGTEHRLGLHHVEHVISDGKYLGQQARTYVRVYGTYDACSHDLKR